MKKDTLYIDVEDDITNLIDRVKTSKEPIVALVLPKRAQMLHSSVNMRLLKRASDESKKRLVLITTEASILKLAGAVSVYTAKNLTSKPFIPEAPDNLDSTETITVEDVAIDASKTVGELAGAAVVGAAVSEKVLSASEADDTIELDNVEAAPESTAIKSDKPKKPKKDRRLKVPNFDKFRLRLFLGLMALALILVAGFFAIYVLPRATITITTETSEIPTKFDFTADINAKTVDEAKKVLPAQAKESKVTKTEKVPATGTKDLGTKAKGFVTVNNCNKEDETISMPTGSRLIVDDAVFLTDAPVTVPASNFTGGGACKKDIARDVDVTAALGGDKYNLSSRSGYTAPDFIDITGFGSNMTGGTSNVVKVVSAEDVETAKQKLLLSNTDEVKKLLESQLRAVKTEPMPETFTTTASDPKSVPAVGEQSVDVAVSIDFTYRMLGVDSAALETTVKKQQDASIDTNTQKIYNDGTDKAKYYLRERKSPDLAIIGYDGTGIAGPQLDAAAIAAVVAGKPGGETKQIIEARPGIASADVRYDPFWVLKTPKKLSRITVKFDVQGEIQ